MLKVISIFSQFKAVSLLKDIEMEMKGENTLRPRMTSSTVILEEISSGKLTISATW